MAKKSMKEAAAAGTSVFDQIASGNVPAAQNTQGVQNAQNTQDTQAAAVQMERINLKIPAYLKEYLQEQAYNESTPRHIVSVTEYLCNLVKKDMEQHKAK